MHPGDAFCISEYIGFAHPVSVAYSIFNDNICAGMFKRASHPGHAFQNLGFGINKPCTTNHQMQNAKEYRDNRRLMSGVPHKPSARAHVGTRTNQGSRIDYITGTLYLHHQLGVPKAPISGLSAAIS